MKMSIEIDAETVNGLITALNEIKRMVSAGYEEAHGTINKYEEIYCRFNIIDDKPSNKTLEFTN